MIRLTDFATVSNADARDAVQGALRTLESLAALEPNWDSYSARPPSPRAIDTARQLLEAVAEAFGDAAGDRVRPYAVAPLADGGVQLEWRSALYDVEVEIGPDGELGYLFVEREGTEEERLTEGDDVSLARALGLVARVLVEGGNSRAKCRALARATRLVIQPAKESGSQ